MLIKRRGLFFYFPSFFSLFPRYRRCAVRYNPARQRNGGAEAIFALAAEAYDVLSDPLRRAVYDRYGEEGLKNGAPGPEGFVKPYVYHGEPARTFRWNGNYMVVAFSNGAQPGLRFESRECRPIIIQRTYLKINIFNALHVCRMESNRELNDD